MRKTGEKKPLTPDGRKQASNIPKPNQIFFVLNRETTSVTRILTDTICSASAILTFSRKKKQFLSCFVWSLLDVRGPKTTFS